jgi:DNA-binding NtrC family response regulator
VEDDLHFRESLALLVEREGFAVAQAGSLEEARKRLAEAPTDVVLVDLGLPDGNGLELLRGTDLPAELVVITGNASVESAVAALHEGAADYLTKPLDRPRLKTVLANVSRTRALKHEVAELRGELRELGRFGPMVGRSPAMQRVYDLIAKVGPTNATVFVTGESGTGKELVAQTVHRLSRRRDEPFLAVNCGAMSPTLIESELFGHEKGSFTGADRRRLGFFEQAHGGTLFLDEITEMPLELQVKLLRVLETGVIVRVGGGDPVPVDVRVIAASNRDPGAAVKDGALREDLLYRLNVFPIELPPLRERGDDVVLLAQSFLEVLNERDETGKRFSEEALERLAALSWPGNVRELRNAVERAAILAERVIGPEMLPDRCAEGVAAVERAPQAGATPDLLQVPVGASIAAVEQRLILATLDRLEGDKKRAAEVLGISLKTLYNRLNVYKAAEGRL